MPETHDFTYVARFRDDVVEWLSANGLVLDNHRWVNSERGTEGTITYEESYWKGIIRNA